MTAGYTTGTNRKDTSGRWQQQTVTYGPIRQAGVTMLELMITIGIIGVIAAFAVPSYQQLTTSSALTTQTNELIASIHHARSEAIKRGQNVTICAADAALNACSGSADWATGWVILDNLANVIHVHSALPTGQTVTESGVTGGTGIVVFNRNGFTTNARTIKLCGSYNKATRARGVILSQVGRVRLATDSNSNGTVEDGGGTDFTCP